ncbi:Far upstream element-binding protein 1 [Colletotrichum chlorophyti]|uniref:Far upstream element-binding protein 1 n=1 Tax=Colletotrichum chlorophyti TaxID=708187 RepID=A0A1Q8RPP6_9PEZI|nr:Far upstream element-binding protein 1 [Colletotrichum chlorophyti]
MAEPPRDISSILAALGAAQRGTSSTPTQAQQPGMPPGYPPPPGAQQPPSYPPMPQSAPPYGAGGGYPLPQPSSSGSLDLSSIRPVNSGTVSIADAIAQAKAFAAEKGVTSYDRPLVYSNEPARAQDPRGYHRSSRSRSPPNRRDQFRDNFNPYRDERRDDRPAPRDYGHGHGRERSYSPGPRGRAFSPRNANGRERSPLRGSGGDDNSETIQIESSLVGLIIGRQGENLRRIESESGCRVQFLPSSDNGPFRQCKITGPRPRRSEVKTAINRIIEDSGMGAINRGAANPKAAAAAAPRDNRGGAAALRDGEDCMQIMVPDRTVGLIIGRGGETIRDLQERSGCHINIVGESKSVNGLRPVNLIGSHESAAQAKDLIMEIVDSDSRNEGQPAAPVKKPSRQDGGFQRDAGPGGGTGGGDKIHDSIYVPSEAVGMIIGKGGETIRDMQNGTGCKINVAQSSGPGEVQREIALIGSRDSIARAKQAIEEKVDAVVSQAANKESDRNANQDQRQKNSGGGGGPGDRGGRGRQNQDYDRSYSQQASNPPASGSTNQPAAQAPAGADGADPYAQYGGYQNYLALWYQSLVYQQQQGGAAAGQPGSQPPPGAS